MTSFLVTLLALIPLVAAPASAKEFKGPKQTIKIEITELGYKPDSIDVKAGTDVTLLVTRRTESTCMREIQVPSKGIAKMALPMNKPVKIALGKVEKGEIKFGCGMDMMESSKLVVH
jgi:plastocyanin domain-containing protein